MTTHAHPTIAPSADVRTALEHARDDRLRRLDAVDDDTTDLVVASQRATLRDTVRAIERAITRIDEGTYGACSGCGEPILAARLERRPWAETCVECRGV